MNVIDEALEYVKEFANPRGLEVAQRTIGYRIKNIGSQAIPVTRMAATPDHSTSQVSLNPGQSICLSRAETALLASKPEVGCTFANGKLVSNSNKKAATDLYNYLAGHYFVFEKTQINTADSHRYSLTAPSGMNGMSASTPDVRMDVRKLESPEIVNTYFTPTTPAQAAQQKAAQAQQTQQNIQKKGLFNGFKR